MRISSAITNLLESAVPLMTFVLVGIPSAGVSQGYKDPVIAEELDPVISNYFHKFDLPGLAVGVVVENEIVYAKGFGFSNIQTEAPVTATTLFHMASDSKPFVAAAVMQLFEQGEVDLDAPVVAFLPYFELDDERYRHITIRQLLQHSSGMPDVEQYEWRSPQYDDEALERYVRRLSGWALDFAPDERYGYSNIGYEVLGDVVAKVSGVSFEDYERDNILYPAGMWNSTFFMPEGMQCLECSKPESLPEGWAAPHMRALKLYVWDAYPYSRVHAPSGTLHSNVMDMCNWAITNMNRGVFGQNRILESSSYDLLWHPHLETGRNSNFYGHSGFTWFIGDYRGERTISHGGGDVGFNSFFVLLPERRTAVVLLSNILPAPLENINNAILDVLFGHEPEPPRPGAFIPVRTTLAERGVEAAVEQWNALKEETEAGLSHYDFGERQLGWTIIDMPGDRVEEATLLAEFCKTVLPEFTETAIYLIERSESGRNSPAGRAMLEVFRANEETT